MDPSADGWTEDERVLQGRSFQELRELIDTYETHLLETIGASNVCRVGERFAVIPHVLGPVNLLLRSHRENPGITWAESVGEARRVAGEIAAASQNGGAVHASEGARPVSHSQIATIAEADMAPLRTGIEDLRREIEELQRWMTRAEMDRAYMDRAGMDRSQVHKAEIDHLQERINYLESALAAVNQQRTADTELVSEQVGNLQRQLSAADSGLAAIYQSRTWRALVRIGRALPGGGKTGAE
jgi:hypothetical protein